MKRLFIIDYKNYDESLPHSKRPSVRGIIRNNGRLAMVYSEKYHYYKLPGGGIEDKETHEEALLREVKEETGLTVIRKSIKEYGSVLRLQKSEHFENTIFEQESLYYFCDVKDNIGKQQLEASEAEAGFVLKYVTLEEAISTNRNCHLTKGDKMLSREIKVLEFLKNEGY